jgi:hypothetical protein
MTCSIDDCPKAAHARGMCGTHYQQWKRTGVAVPAAREARMCSECHRPHYSKGMCSLHYYRVRTHGTTALPTVPFADRFWATVEGQGENCWFWMGNVGKVGYGRLSRNDTLVYAHRIAYELAVGPIPDDLTIDHLCRVRTCCNPTHLEPITRAENSRREGLARSAA